MAEADEKPSPLSAGDLLVPIIEDAAGAVLQSSLLSVRNVHTTRTAIRRLRAYLRTFRPLLDMRWSTGLSVELQWYQQLFAPIRDLDVVSKWLDAAEDFAGSADTAGAIEVMKDMLKDQRNEARRIFIETRSSTRGSELLGKLDLLRHEVPLGARASNSTKVFLPLVRKARRELQDAERIMAEDPSRPHIHEARIKAKSLRYACEALAPHLGRSFSRIGADAESIQDRLGGILDTIIACEWLERNASADPRTAFSAGKLWAAGQQRWDTDRLRLRNQ